MPIGKQVIEEMQKKCVRLKRPRYCSVRPVLIHVNGVEESVHDAEYFDTIVEFGQLLA
ncbi:MAG: hypothetical protein K0U13_04580 [Chlamydiae bacterium]|nr:hypothetical protein [Chlamydiota bacterium]